MKNAMLIAVVVLASYQTWAASVDYAKLKPEDYARLEHGYKFTDDAGNRLRVENTGSRKGLFLQQTVDGTEKWVKHGAFYEFDGKGTKTEMTTYAFGARDGVREKYYPNGIVNFRYNYKENHEHGIFEQFDDEGKPVEKYTLEYNPLKLKSQKQGKSYNYQKGKLNFEKYWVDGKLHGELIQYNTSNGKVVGRSKYVDGVQVGKTEWHL